MLPTIGITPIHNIGITNRIPIISIYIVIYNVSSSSINPKRCRFFGQLRSCVGCLKVTRDNSLWMLQFSFQINKQYFLQKLTSSAKIWDKNVFKSNTVLHAIVFFFTLSIIWIVAWMWQLVCQKWELSGTLHQC